MITDTCCCGSVFKTNGSRDENGYDADRAVHEDWLRHHRACSAPPKIVYKWKRPQGRRK